MMKRYVLWSRSSGMEYIALFCSLSAMVFLTQFFAKLSRMGPTSSPILQCASQDEPPGYGLFIRWLLLDRMRRSSTRRLPLVCSDGHKFSPGTQPAALESSRAWSKHNDDVHVRIMRLPMTLDGAIARSNRSCGSPKIDPVLNQQNPRWGAASENVTSQACNIVSLTSPAATLPENHTSRISLNGLTLALDSLLANHRVLIIRDGQHEYIFTETA
jgi:hypothetical protein